MGALRVPHVINRRRGGDLRRGTASARSSERWGLGGHIGAPMSSIGGGAVMALRVVCYVNQFFGQLGGEEKAGVGPHVVDGAVGAARAVQQALGDAGTVVATVICGDNYVAEHADRAVAELVAVVAAARPDLVIAGPAFLAGRYGVACGALCAAVQAQLKIPAVTGMHAENPGVELYRRQGYVVPTGSEATRMLEEVKRLVPLGLKLPRGEAIGAPVAEG